MPKPKSRENGKLGGRPKGSKNPSTITKEAARLALAQLVYAHMEDLVGAQLANAKGIKYLVARDKTGKFKRLTEDDTERILSGEESEVALIEVWEKDPNVQAFTDLMNRALDKPKEQELEVKVSTPEKMSDAELREKLAAISTALKVQA